MEFITDWVQEKAAGYLLTGIQAGGALAGNAVGGVGSLIESGGRSIGEGSVNGGIRMVGNSINGYGEGIKQAMSADGPVSSAEKKKPVRPTSAVKNAPSAQKALPLTAGAPKALPAPSKRSASTSKPVAQSSKPRAPANGKVRINPDSRSQPSGRAVKPTGTGTKPKPMSNAATNPAKKPMQKPTPDGKVRISPESRPKLAAK